MAARALPVTKTRFHNLSVRDNQAQTSRTEDDNKKPVVMPEFQARSQAKGQNEIKCRVYPSERAAVVDKLIQAVKLLPGLFKAWMADGRRHPQRAFDHGDVGAESLPEH